MSQNEEPLGRLKECLLEVEDPRIDRRKRHSLLNVLILALGAVICGQRGWEEIAEFAEDYEDYFKTILDLPNGTPSKDTFRRVCMVLDPKSFYESFIKFMNLAAESSEGEIIAIDGKTIRRSFDQARLQSPLHLLTAWAVKNQVVLGQMKVEKKTNEITAIPEMIKLLNLKGAVVTVDALNCQKTTAAAVKSGEGEWVFTLKSNQPTLYSQVKKRFELFEKMKFEDVNYEFDEQVNKDHGRFEIRKYWQVEMDWKETKKNWPGFQTIGCVEAHRTLGEKTSVERRYFISSLPLNIKKFSEAVRAHWQVESTHYILDVLFQEDQSRIREKTAAENFAALRKMALSLLKRAPEPWKKSGNRKFSMAGKGRHATRHPEEYLSRVFLSGI